MLVIRLFRVGRKNQPSFKIVVTDKRQSATAGRFVEEIGFYNPVTKEKVLNVERIKYWLSVGAKPSNTIFNFFITEKVIEGKKIPAHKKSKKLAEAAPAVGAAPAAAPAPVATPAPKVEAPKAPAPEKPAEVKLEAPAKEEAKPEAPAEQK